MTAVRHPAAALLDTWEPWACEALWALDRNDYVMSMADLRAAVPHATEEQWTWFLREGRRLGIVATLPFGHVALTYRGLDAGLDEKARRERADRLSALAYRCFVDSVEALLARESHVLSRMYRHRFVERLAEVCAREE